MHSKIMNIGIMAHVDSGKTTLTERVLHAAGATARPGNVDDGNTVTDSLEVERRRGITVKSGAASLFWRDTKINIIDTPGHMDFICEVERSFAALDGAVLVVSAREGVQMQTKVIFGMLRRLNVPAIIFINKLDRVGADVAAVHEQIRRQLTPDILPVQRAEAFPGGFSIQKLDPNEIAEPVAERDAAFLEVFASGQGFTGDDLDSAIRRLTAACQIYPVCHGSALKGEGIDAFLDCAVDYLPGSPQMDELSGYVFKIDKDEKGFMRSYIRLFGGGMAVRESVPVLGGGIVKARKLLSPVMGAIITVDRVSCGDIAVLENEKGLNLGDVLGKMTVSIPNPSAEKAFMQTSVEPENEADRQALMDELRDIAREDPMLDVTVDSESREISLRVLGETQAEVIQSMIFDRRGVRARFGPMRTVYKETPLRAAKARIFFGWPNPFSAGIEFEISPLPPHSGIVYERAVSYGDLKEMFQKGVEEGALAACARGLYGWELTDMRIRFTDMRFDSISGTPAAYRQLAPYVINRALRLSGTRLLEPVCAFTADIPSALSGKVVYEIERMRGRVEEIVSKGDLTGLKGIIPMQTSRTYQREIHAVTQGMGHFTPEPHGFEIYPGEPERSGRRNSREVERQVFLFREQDEQVGGYAELID